MGKSTISTGPFSIAFCMFTMSGISGSYPLMPLMISHHRITESPKNSQVTIAFLLWGLPEYAIEEIGGSAEVTWPPGLQWDATPWDWLCQWGPQNFTDWIRENGDPLDPIDPWLWGYPILRQSNINPGYDEDVSSKMQPETLKRLFDFFESFVAGPWQLTTSTRLHRHKFGIELLPGSTPRSIKNAARLWSCQDNLLLRGGFCGRPWWWLLRKWNKPCL